MSSSTLLRLLIALVFVNVALAAEEAYEIGGPLAGKRLPPFPTQFGEPAGHPGCLPDRATAGQADREGSAPFTPQQQAPELLLYPGSVEHWRAYMFKYMPIRSAFDEQSQLRNFIAPEIPGAAKEQVEQYAAPLHWVPRHAPVVNTGKTTKPVPVVRCRVGSPTFALDLGELPEGMYAVRVIGAVETKSLRNFREPLYLKMTVNDGPAGQASTYRVRIGYCDEFYSVAEIYFHALTQRRYEAKLRVDAGSKVDLLVHNISLDDALAGCVREAVKTRRTLENPSQAGEAPAPQGLPKEHRLARDAAIWELFPPINAQACIAAGHGNIDGIAPGTDGMSDKEIEEKFGKWEVPTPAEPGVFLVNKKLNLKYTCEDLRLQRPLPDPYPLKDDGAGLFFPDPAKPESGRYWGPIGQGVTWRWRESERPPALPLPKGHPAESPDRTRDAAVALIRYAFAFPAIDAANAFSSVMTERGPFGRDYRCRRRETTADFMDHYMNYARPLYAYDRLFDFIKDNQELADSVGRFVPWVRTPKDVIKLLDVYLVQTTAKRILRYQYHTDPMEIANAAAVLGDNRITEPWMQWLFSRTFIYPLPPAGVQDAMITGCCRDGCEYIGSTFYAQGEGALRTAAALERYRRAGGEAKWNLSDRVLYPKPVAQCYWRLNTVVAGGDFLRIGDVSGPDKAPGHTLRDLDFAQQGWDWTGDPRFAFILKHHLRGGSVSAREADADRIDAAAAKVRRAPWLDNASRVMPMWAGALETGHQHDDLRFRRAAYLRVGFGTGHEHDDSLDLQVVAHGLPATIDAGQRTAPRYSTPPDSASRVHNLVEVNGQSHHVYSWVRALSDAPGARYLSAEAVPPNGSRLYGRQIALIDVDEGEGSKPLSIEQQRPGTKLPPVAKTANSYVFDVARVSGGSSHAYCFHGPVNDEFDWNAREAAAVQAGTADADYLATFKMMPESKAAGASPRVLEATWRLIRESRGFGAEKMQLGVNLDPAAPRRFTRLHLLDAEGLRALKAQLVCFQWKYDFTCLMARKTAAQGQELESAFAAIIEPYVGQPFIPSQRTLAIDKNETDARRAVAVEVTTANGHTDLCFADGRPEQTRKIAEARLMIAGEFAFYSTDSAGLRLAALTGGTMLAAPAVRIELAHRERRAKVVKVDYSRKTLWIDQPWPARSTDHVFEIGLPGRMTTYTASRITPDAAGTLLALTQGADYYRSRIESVDEKTGVVKCVLPLTMGQRPGIDRSWVASDDAMKTFWRADVVGRGVFKLTGPPVTSAAFASAGALRLWEYGVGDEVRRSTSASIRRIGDGLFEFRADVDANVYLHARSAQISSDQKVWTDAGSYSLDSWLCIKVPAPKAGDVPVCLKVTVKP